MTIFLPKASVNAQANAPSTTIVLAICGKPGVAGSVTVFSVAASFTVVPSRNRDVRLVYETRQDGSLRILQYVAPAGSGKWVKYGDLSYRRNR